MDYSLCDVGFEAAPPRTSVRSPVQVKESWTQTKLTALGKPHRLTPALHTVKKRNRISYGGKKSGDDDLKQEDEIEEENEIGSQMKAEGMDVGNEFDAGSQGEHITTKSKKSRVKVEGNSEDEDEEWSPAKLRRHRSRSQKQELDSTTEASDAEDFYAEDHLFPRTPSRRAAKVKAEKLISSVGNNDNESDVEEVHIISDIEGSDHGDHHEDDDGVDDEKIKSEENCKVDVKSEWDTESSVNKDLMEKIKQEPSDLDPILKSGQVRPKVSNFDSIWMSCIAGTFEP